jgi:hypothetical protein
MFLLLAATKLNYSMFPKTRMNEKYTWLILPFSHINNVFLVE